MSFFVLARREPFDGVFAGCDHGGENLISIVAEISSESSGEGISQCVFLEGENL